MVWHHIIPHPHTVSEGTGSYSAPFPVAVEGISRLTPGQLKRINRAAAGVTGIEAPIFVAGGGEPHGTHDVAPPAHGEAPPAAAATPRSTDATRAGVSAATEREAYTLSVTETAIAVTADAAEGCVAALAALTAAILHETEPGDRSVTLDAAVISDRPHAEWRGFMLDTARHFFRAEALDGMLDILWLLRLNRFHLHLTDDQGWRFPVPEYPLLTEVGGYRHDGTSEDGRYGGAYTREELRRLDDDARALGITIVPEIDLPGHASAALTAYPELSADGAAPGVETRWGIFHNVLCAEESTLSAFVDAVFSAVAETFHGPYIHVGGDEVPDASWERCPADIRGENPYQRIVRAMTEVVERLGRRPVAWDEAANLDLPKSTIIVNWRRPADAAAAMARGYDLVLAPETRAAYLDHKHLDDDDEPGRLGVCTVADSARFSPDRYVQEHVTGLNGDDGTILGGQGNLWTETVLYFRNVEYMAIVRLAAIAEGVWRGAPAEEIPTFFDDLDTLRSRLARRGFSVYPGRMV